MSCYILDMTNVSSRCRAKNRATCPVHGINFPTTINFSKGTFKPNPANDVEKSLKNSKNYTLLLQEKEKESLSAYCKQDYTPVADWIYGGESYSSANPQQLIKNIDSALTKYEKIPDRPSRVLYRATRLYDKSFATPEEATSYMKKNFQPGSTFETKGYMSTTPNAAALFDFLTESFDDLTINPKHPFGFKSREEYTELSGKDRGLSNVIYEIETRNAAPVSALGDTYAEKEQEYLLGRGKKFQIIEVIPHTPLNNPTGTSGVLKKRHATVVRVREIEN